MKERKTIKEKKREEGKEKVKEHCTCKVINEKQRRGVCLNTRAMFCLKRESMPQSLPSFPDSVNASPAFFQRKWHQQQTQQQPALFSRIRPAWGTWAQPASPNTAFPALAQS